MTPTTLTAMRRTAGIEVITTLWFSGYVSHAVMQDGQKVRTFASLERALARADEIAGELIESEMVGELDVSLE